ncbi:hypothetical protein GA0061098_1002336 [Bradyrhizobium shewense]|uniref:Uncharacterized protein n=1 Tax=Bradyrhizobium shewense TaxID=1761772 RepID=A0A1C3URJ7_9BRAD|nr:hypothetical protein GA0061098_1002336 [Bradyrhizobium shewense]
MQRFSWNRNMEFRPELKVAGSPPELAERPRPTQKAPLKPGPSFRTGAAQAQDRPMTVFVYVNTAKPVSDV